MDFDIGHSRKRSNLLGRSPATWLTLIYLAISWTWIVTSDSLATRFSSGDPAMLEKVQQYKGLFFVGLSGLLLYVVSNKFYRNLVTSFQYRQSLEKKFFALSFAAREGIFDYDLLTGRAELSPKMRFFLPGAGEQLDEFWIHYQQRIHPDDISQVRKEYDEIARTGKPVWQIEYRLLGSDGKYYPVVSSIYLLRNHENGRPLRLVGTILDVSEVRQLQFERYEQKLRHKQEMAASMIRAQETERERWAQELHDNVCQLLTVGNMYLGQMERRPASISQLLPQAKKLMAESIAEIRQLSASIKPPSFELDSLRECLEKLTCNIGRVKDINFKFHIDQLQEEKLNADQKLLVYRVIQEQINNIIKYADARNVDISLEETDEIFWVKVKDDGKGFDPASIQKGLGLRNIRSRLQLHKGSLEIDTSPGRGCSLVGSFPLS